MKLKVIERSSAEGLESAVNAFLKVHGGRVVNCQRNLWYEFNADGTRVGGVHRAWTAFVLYGDE